MMACVYCTFCKNKARYLQTTQAVTVRLGGPQALTPLINCVASFMPGLFACDILSFMQDWNKFCRVHFLLPGRVTGHLQVVLADGFGPLEVA